MGTVKALVKDVRTVGRDIAEVVVDNVIIVVDEKVDVNGKTIMT